MSSETRTFAVIGLGTFGARVASDLADYGNEVIGVDIDETRVADLADQLHETVVADARDEEALREAGVGHCKVALIAIGGDLEASIVAAMHTRLLGIEEIWAKAETKTHHRILSSMGVHRVVHADDAMGRRVGEMMHNPLVRDFVSLGNGFYVVVVEVPEALAGESLTGLKLNEKFDLRCLEVMSGRDRKLGENGDCTLEEGDRMLLLGRQEQLRAFSDSF